MILEVRDLSCGYGAKSVLSDVSFRAVSNEIICLLGPNGVGKTTLFKTILGFMKPQGGEIMIDGESVANWPRKRFAKAIGYVPQVHTPSFPFAVKDVVVMGRKAQFDAFSSPRKHDLEIADECLETLGIQALRDRAYTQLSGGERQMVLIARAMAQEAGVLVMDEPTNNLDYGNQMRVLRQIKLLAQNGLAIIMTTHDPNQTFLCADKVLLIQKNNKTDFGSVRDVISSEKLRALYGTEVKIMDAVSDDEADCTRVCVPFLGDLNKK